MSSRSLLLRGGRYDEAFSSIDGLAIPKREPTSTHVFHQYTLKVSGDRRDALKAHLEERGVPSMIYYPLPLYRQTAFERYVSAGFALPVTEELCGAVLSLPIHTEMREDVQDRIIEGVVEFFGANAAVGGAN